MHVMPNEILEGNQMVIVCDLSQKIPEINFISYLVYVKNNSRIFTFNYTYCHIVYKFISLYFYYKPWITYCINPSEYFVYIDIDYRAQMPLNGKSGLRSHY